MKGHCYITYTYIPPTYSLLLITYHSDFITYHSDFILEKMGIFGENVVTLPTHFILVNIFLNYNK